MEVDTVYDEDDCEKTQTEVGECAESPVFRFDKHGSKDECNATGGTGGTLQYIVSIRLLNIMSASQDEPGTSVGFLFERRR
jgi:hypothetical protein